MTDRGTAKAGQGAAVPGDLLAGKRALIAGGTGNVGRVVVEAFLGAGATVVVPSRSAEKASGLRERLGAGDDRLITLVGDLGTEGAAEGVRERILEQVGPLDAVVATLGRFVAAPSVLAAPVEDLRAVLDGYLVGHFMVARTLIPLLEERGGAYTFINGPLAFDPLFPGSGLISIATAAQAMLARVVMKEFAESPVRVNELVLYTSFGRADEEQRRPGDVSQEEVGRYLAWLASDAGAGVRGESIHLKTSAPLRELAGIG